MPSFFFPILAHITESTALKGREQTLFSLESIKSNRKPQWGTGSRGLCEPTQGEETDRVCTFLNHSIFAACLLCQPRCDLLGTSVSLI